MENMIVNKIENAILNHEEIFVSMEIGTNTGLSITIMPESVDNGNDSCIIYSDDGIYNFKIDNVIYDEQEDEFVCISDGCTIVISFY